MHLSAPKRIFWRSVYTVTTEPAAHSFYRRRGKRLLDLALTGLLIPALLPVAFVAGLLVWFTSPGPVFFVQPRIGKGGRVFNAYKFRTMIHRPRLPDPHCEIFGRNAEVTAVGYWLRRFKIDELPQLLNVLKGEMSLVGPRPALTPHLAEFDALAHQRLLVAPGLTGLAQVHGNIYLSWPQRWRYDAYYVQALSLGLDLWILLRTLGVIVWGEEHWLHTAWGEEQEEVLNG
jgi:undecaprenyl phosphate N,N'-diacetylbacillosamine 1-phosphate transferase